jgi:hypothetical protein
MDFCARCGEPYCENCLEVGCCGVEPIESGVEREEADQLDAVRSAAYGDLGLPKEDVS